MNTDPRHPASTQPTPAHTNGLPSRFTDLDGLADPAPHNGRLRLVQPSTTGGSPRLTTSMSLEECVTQPWTGDPLELCRRELAESPNDDLTHTRFFVRLFGQQLRHITELGRWIRDTGPVWEPLSKDEVRSRIGTRLGDFCHRLVLETSDKKVREHLQRHRSALGNGTRINAVAKLAQGVLELSANQLNRRKDVINCPNGVVCLRTGQIVERRPDDFFTHTTSVEYDPNAESSELWTDHLNKLFDSDREVIEYFQRVVGNSMSGDRSRHEMYLLYGSASNGKSATLLALKSVLGGFAAMADQRLIRKGDRKPNDEVNLVDARFIAITEIDAGAILDAAKTRQWACEDLVQAEKKYGDPFQFDPMGNLFLATNYYLNVDGDDEGTQRRLRFLPCPRTITKQEIILDILERFRRPEHAGAILKWVVDGAMQALACDREFDVPSAVEEFTDEITYENDHIQQWIDEQCEVGPDQEGTAQRLYESFCEWSNRVGRKSYTMRRLGEALSKKGFERYRKTRDGRKVTVYIGLRHSAEPVHFPRF